MTKGIAMLIKIVEYAERNVTTYISYEIVYDLLY